MSRCPLCGHELDEDIDDDEESSKPKLPKKAPLKTIEDAIEDNNIHYNEDGDVYIYESPDEGKTIFRRIFGDYDNRAES